MGAFKSSIIWWNIFSTEQPIIRYIFCHKKCTLHVGFFRLWLWSFILMLSEMPCFLLILYSTLSFKPCRKQTYNYIIKYNYYQTLALWYQLILFWGEHWHDLSKIHLPFSIFFLIYFTNLNWYDHEHHLRVEQLRHQINVGA